MNTREPIIQTKIKYLGWKHKVLEEVKEVKNKITSIICIRNNERNRYYCLNCLEEIKDISVTIMDTEDYQRNVLGMTEKEILHEKRLREEVPFGYECDNKTRLLRFYCRKCNIHQYYHFDKNRDVSMYPVNNKPLVKENKNVDTWYIKEFYIPNYINDSAKDYIGETGYTDKIRFVKDMTNKIFGAYVYATYVMIFYDKKTDQISFVKKHIKIQYRYHGSTGIWTRMYFICKKGNYVPMSKKMLKSMNFANQALPLYAAQDEIQSELRFLNCKDEFAFVKFSINCLFEMGLQSIDYKKIISKVKNDPSSNEYSLCEKLFMDSKIPNLTIEDKEKLNIYYRGNQIFLSKYFNYIKKESKEGRDAFFKKADVLPHTKKARQLINKSLAYAFIYKRITEYGFKNLDLFYQICDFDEKNTGDIKKLLRVCFSFSAKRFFKNYLKYSSEKKILMDIKNTNPGIINDTIMMYNKIYRRGCSKLLVTAGGKSLFKLSIMEIHDEISRINNRLVEDKHLDVALSNKKQKELSNTYTYNDDEYEFSIVTENLKLIEIGQVMNICVGSYGSKVNNHNCNIVSVVKNKNTYAACIELDGSGKSICQAKGYRNNYLHENTHHVVTQWIADHKLQIQTEDLTNVLKSVTNQKEHDYHHKEVGEVNMIPEKF